MERSRRRAVFVIGAVAVVLVVVVVAALAWYVLGEERRLGGIVAGMLAERTGLVISVERARTDGRGLTLRGVHVGTGPGFPLDVRISELAIDGGIVSLVAPAGRHLSIVATQALVAVTATDPLAAPNRLEQVRRTVVDALQWPGLLTVNVDGGELRTATGTHRFDLTAEKSASDLDLTLTLEPEAGRRMRMTARIVGAEDGAVEMRVVLAAEPAALGALWPAALPLPAALGARGDLRLLRTGDVTATGRITLGAAPTPAVVDFASRYDGDRSVLTVSRYQLEWTPEVRLEGAGSVEASGSALALAGTAQGTLDGSAVNGRLAWKTADGTFEGEVKLGSVDARRLARRLDATSVPAATARELHARFSGRADTTHATASLDADARGLVTATLAGGPVDATLRAGLTVARGDGTLALTRVADGRLSVTRNGRTVLAAIGSSRGAQLWPLTVDARVDDLTALAPLLPLGATVTGTARFVGDVASAQPPSFRGSLEAQLPRLELQAGARVALTGVRAALPVDWRGAATPVSAAATSAARVTETKRDDSDVKQADGSVSVEAVEAFGVRAERLTSSAWMAGGQLDLPDIRFAQYGGQGTGWLQAAMDGRATPFRARLEADRVDLGRYVREAGWTIAKATGIVHYLITVFYAETSGLTVAGHLDSDEGGEISIDAIEKLLDSAMVQEESTGILGQTLENLRVFQYSSLEGDLRVSRGDGRLDLTLVGKKRFGIFPAPVKAINLRNVPLSLLQRTFLKGTTP